MDGGGLLPNCQDMALARARDAYRSGEDVVLDVRLPDGCGFTFMAIVNTCRRATRHQRRRGQLW